MEDNHSSTNVAAFIVPIVFSIIFVLGVIGNTLVMVVMVKTCKKESKGLNTTNRFILNLAIADLLFLFFCVPFQAPVYSMDGWPFGSFMCTFSEVCQMTCMLASIYTMVALSVDRYFAIVYATSTRQYRTQANATKCIVGIWIIAIGLGAAAANTRRQYTVSELEQIMKSLAHTTEIIPQLETTGENESTTSEYHFETDFTTYHHETDNDNMALCIPRIDTKPFQKIYKVVVAILGYLVPLLLIFLCYLGVIKAMSKNVRNVAASANKINKQRSQEAKKRVTKIVIIVVIFFAIHWFPYHVTELWLSYWDFELSDAFFALIILAYCLSYANSCVNPLIYAFMSKRIRGELKKFFCCQYLSKTFVDMKKRSRDFISLKSDLKKTDSNNKGELKDMSEVSQLNNKTSNGKKKETKQTIVFAEDGSCVTCLTTLTPASCHKGNCFSYDSSSKFITKATHPINDIFSEDSHSNDDEIEVKEKIEIEISFNSLKNQVKIINELQIPVQEIIHENHEDLLLKNPNNNLITNQGLPCGLDP